MLERRTSPSGRRIAAIALAALAHGAAVALLTVPGLFSGGPAPEPSVVPLVYVAPVAPRLGGGGSPVQAEPLAARTPAKPSATPEFVQPQAIPDATPDPTGTPDDDAGVELARGGEPGIPGLPPGPGSPDGHPDSECLENCTRDGLPGFPSPVFVLAPVPLSQTRPAYPANARALGLTGSVTVEILVGVDGRVQQARITKGQPQFDEATLAAVRSWRYAPVLHEGKPILWKSTVTVRFELDASGRPR